MSSVNFTGQNVAAFIFTGFDHLPYQKLLGFLILLDYMLILVGSGTNICIIVTDRRLHKPMYLLICNLAVVDIMYTTSICTTMIAVLLAEVKSISYNACIVHMFFYHLGGSNLMLALPVMALDRSIAISYPLRYTTILTNSRTFGLIIATWVLSAILMGYLYYLIADLPYCQPVLRYVFCDGAAMIRAACIKRPERYFRIPAIISIFLMTPFCFIVMSYMQIIYTVLKLANNKSRAQAFNTCASHLIVVVSFYAPKFVANLLTRVGVRLNLTERNAVQTIAALLPPLINPIVYCLKTKEIRTRLIQILTKNNVAVLK